jgi:hypothetical protein
MFSPNAIAEGRARRPSDAAPSRIGRRELLALTLAGGAAGCSPKTSPFWGTLFGGLGRSANQPVSIERARALPYASMIFWFEGTARALLVLGGRDANDNLQWFSSGRQSVNMFGPFVTQVFGTEVQLLRTMMGPEWRSDPRAMVGQALLKTIELQADTGRSTTTLRSRFSDEGADEVEVLGEKLRLRRIVEAVTVENRARFENNYWVDDASGRCLKSRQLAVPTMPFANIEYVKLPRA